MTQVGMMLMEEGIQRGMREGMQKGMQKEAAQTAVNMLKSGKFSCEEIQKYVPRLSVEEIQEIARKVNSPS